MEKTLVVCYSRSGTTRKLGRQVAEALGADFDPIEDVIERAGALGYARSLLEAVAKGLPSIRVRRDPRDYALVVLGTPVWAGTLASPMRSYLLMHRDRFQNIACFCTQGGRGAESVLREIRTLCGFENAPTFSATTREVAQGRHEQALRRFTSSLKAPTMTGVSAVA